LLDPGLAIALLSPIDYGFERHEEFDRGEVDMRAGTESVLEEISALQARLSAGSRCLGALSVVLLGASVIGIPYLLGKLILVRRGEIAIAESVGGNPRVLGAGAYYVLYSADLVFVTCEAAGEYAGWHLLETLNASVRRAKITDDVIQQGCLHVIRVLPGHFGLGLQNGHPVVLLPGRHLINDPLFAYAGAKVMTDPHIAISTTHLITVAQGQVGLCTVNTTAHFLEPGASKPRLESVV